MPPAGAVCGPTAVLRLAWRHVVNSPDHAAPLGGEPPRRRGVYPVFRHVVGFKPGGPAFSFGSSAGPDNAPAAAAITARAPLTRLHGLEPAASRARSVRERNSDRAYITGGPKGPAPAGPSRIAQTPHRLRSQPVSAAGIRLQPGVRVADAGSPLVRQAPSSRPSRRGPECGAVTFASVCDSRRNENAAFATAGEPESARVGRA
jgi:hypothetical protein